MSLRSFALAAAVSLAAAATTVSTPVSAADILVVPETATVRVSYADLDLASEAGRARLDRRIANAARGICGNYQPNDLRIFSLVRDCRADAIASARIPTGLAAADGAATLTGRRLSRAAD